MKDSITVVLVDDHRIVRRGLRSFLESFPDLTIVGEAASGEEALQHIEEWLPDVVIMDLLMPGGMDGVKATRTIRQVTPHTQVVVLTSSTEDARVIAALQSGAIGYVRKDADPNTLLVAVRAAALGQSLLDPAVANIVLHELTRQNKASSTSSELTQRELEVLRQLALGSTNREIAATLVVSEETIKTHVGNILTKLQLAHRTQAVLYALKHNLISLDEIDLS